MRREAYIGQQRFALNVGSRNLQISNIPRVKNYNLSSEAPCCFKGPPHRIKAPLKNNWITGAEVWKDCFSGTRSVDRDHPAGDDRFNLIKKLFAHLVGELPLKGWKLFLMVFNRLEIGKTDKGKPIALTHRVSPTTTI